MERKLKWISDSHGYYTKKYEFLRYGIYLNATRQAASLTVQQNNIIKQMKKED